MPYSPEDKERILSEVLDSIATGQSLRASCRSVGVPLATVQDWIDAGAELSGQYAHARASLIDVLTDEIESIADRVEADQAAVAKARLQIDARKWNLSKVMPRRFGDKVQTEVTGKDGGAIQTVTEIVRKVVRADGSQPDNRDG
jgi:transposase-like protein